MKFIILKFLLTIAFISLSKADLPIHCLKSNIIGKWKFYAIEPKEINKPDELYNLLCGHEMPSNEKSSHFSLAMTQTQSFKNTFEVEFTDNQAVSGKKKGTWTMIYDEGFEFKFNSNTPDNENYFVFSKYGPNNNNPKYSSKWVSYCNQTLVGWYKIGKRWGCFYGHKDIQNYDVITNGEAENKQKVTENSIIFAQKRDSVENIDDKLNSFLRVSRGSRFTETENSELLDLNANFKDHSKLVERINSANLSWKAKNYDEFIGLTRGEIKKMTKTLKITDERNRIKKFKKKDAVSYKNKKKSNENFSCPVLDKRQDIKYEDLPETFNAWENFMTPAGSQGGCGSCYAMSTISMLEARFRIHECENLLKIYGSQANSKNENSFDILKKFKISLDHTIKCSYYNQECDGGYSILVSKFFNEFELYPEECWDVNNSSTCYQTICQNKKEYADKKFTVKDYYYVGGSYGKTDANNLKMELYKNGPIAVSFEPDELFYNYSQGILDFTDEDIKKLGIKVYNNNDNSKSKPEWQKVDHSVVLIGWGKENLNGKEIEFWILQNSWGAGWGENGNFRVKAGVNLMSIESIGEVGIPAIETINQSKRKFKKKF